MKHSSRFTLLLTALAVFAASPSMPAQDETPVPLDAAVRKFNARAAEHPIGKAQPPLTDDAVIAAIRWNLLDREKLNISDETARLLDAVPQTRTLPEEFTLEFEEGYEPNDRVTFDAWMVKLRIPGGVYGADGGSTAIVISKRMIRSRLIGEEERKVINAWGEKERKRGASVGSFQRVEYLRRYRAEREAAAALDAAR